MNSKARDLCKREALYDSGATRPVSKDDFLTSGMPNAEGAIEPSAMWWSV